MNVFGMGAMEITVILVVALVIFGPGKLPEIGAQLGKGLRDFRRATRDLTAEFQESITDVQSTMDEMKQTVTDVKRETSEIARSIPQTIEGTDGSAASQPAMATTINPTTAKRSTPVTSPPLAAPTPARSTPAVATRADPLADFGGFDEPSAAPERSDAAD